MTFVMGLYLMEVLGKVDLFDSWVGESEDGGRTEPFTFSELEPIFAEKMR